MTKILIMSLAVVGSILTGGSVMASLFAFVMITGLLVESLWAETDRRIMECPARIARPELEGAGYPPSA